jgi:hypothetical protein
MTTLSTTRSDSLLRLAMRADAVLSGLCGIALIAAARPLVGFTGLPKGVEYGVGAAFVVYATVVFLDGASLCQERLCSSVVWWLLAGPGSDLSEESACGV